MEERIVGCATVRFFHMDQTSFPLRALHARKGHFRISCTSGPSNKGQKSHLISLDLSTSFFGHLICAFFCIWSNGGEVKGEGKSRTEKHIVYFFSQNSLCFLLWLAHPSTNSRQVRRRGLLLPFLSSTRETLSSSRFGLRAMDLQTHAQKSTFKQNPLGKRTNVCKEIHRNLRCSPHRLRTRVRWRLERWRTLCRTPPRDGCQRETPAAAWCSHRQFLNKTRLLELLAGSQNRKGPSFELHGPLLLRRGHSTSICKIHSQVQVLTTTDPPRA